MFKILLFVIAVAGPALVNSLAFEPCANGAPTPLALRVAGCPIAPCRVPNGGLVDMNLDFIMTGPSTTLTASLSIFLGPIQIPFSLPQAQTIACNYITGASCPLNGNEIINYSLATVASAPINDVTVTQEFQLVNDLGVPVLCYRSQATIIPAA